MKLNIFAVAVLLVSACAQPGENKVSSQQKLRPGLGADYDFASMSPVIGKTVRWTLSINGVERAEVSLEIAELPDGTFEHKGVSRSLSPNGPSSDLYANTDNARRSFETRTDSQTVVYVPHDCTNVIGECRYVRTVAKSEGVVDEQHLIAETTENDGIWHKIVRFDESSDPKNRSGVFLESHYSNAKDGFFIDVRNIAHGEDGRTIEWRREDQ